MVVINNTLVKVVKLNLKQIVKMETANSMLNVISHPDFGEVRSKMVKGEPWFVAKDVCDVLGLINSRKALLSLDADEKGVTISDTLGGKQEMATINESGMYSLIFQSRKPEAKRFRKWVTSEVLPAIRRQGFYIHPSAQLSKAEFRKIERLMREGVKAYITNEDIWKCHTKLRLPEAYINRVLGGIIVNNSVMDDLQQRAIVNKEVYKNAYSPARMQQVTKILSNK